MFCSFPAACCSGARRILARCVFIVAVTMACSFAPEARAQTQNSAAYGSDAVRALFLKNFLSFTQWPAELLPEDAPYVIGVAGSRSLEEELLALADKRSAQDRRIRVVRIKNSRDLAGCHLVYINPLPAPGEESSPSADELLPLLRKQPVLTVSSSPTFLAEGGIVNLVIGAHGRLGFEISTDNAKAADLVLSSKLLSLARIVNPPRTGGSR